MKITMTLNDFISLIFLYRKVSQTKIVKRFKFFTFGSHLNHIRNTMSKVINLKRRLNICLRGGTKKNQLNDQTIGLIKTINKIFRPNEIA